MQKIPNIKTTVKIPKILNEVRPEVQPKTIEKVKAGFIKPKTNEE